MEDPQPAQARPSVMTVTVSQPSPDPWRNPNLSLNQALWAWYETQGNREVPPHLFGPAHNRTESADQRDTTTQTQEESSTSASSEEDEEDEDVVGGWENATAPPLEDQNQIVHATPLPKATEEHEYGIHMIPAAAYPEKALYQKRLKTFKYWPPSNSHRPETLARLGFFYKNKSDHIYCWFCGGGLKHLEPKDNIKEEHAKFFPDCFLCKFHDSPLGIRQVEREKLAANIRNGEATTATLLSRISDLEDQLICRVCLDNGLSVALAPCGHLVCNLCVFALKTCPFCRKEVNGVMKIYLH